jgi:resuscitation-promoting factor RpfB
MKWTILLLALILLAACEPAPEEESFFVYVVADGVERTFAYTNSMTVEELLDEAAIETGEQDRINPQPFTQITNGMRITIVRVTEESQCDQSTVPFTRREVLDESRAPGEQVVAQVGENGTEEICYRVRFDDGVERDRVEVRRTVVVPPREEIVMVGPIGALDPVPVNGTLVYISNNNAWVIRGSSGNKRPITSTSDLDGRVFALSPDGTQLLFTRIDPTSFNQLWLIPNVVSATTPVQLIPQNVLDADWVPGRANTLSYSTCEPRSEAPGWNAYNDLMIMRIDPNTGTSLSTDVILERETRGLYSWWGMEFHWSPDGTQLAWVQADSIGLVNFDNPDDLTPLVTYPFYQTGGGWSWRANVSWSEDSSLLLTTVHGPPVRTEQPENSPAFDLAATDTLGSFVATINTRVGIWSAPRYSPLIALPDGSSRGYLAYLRARDPLNSVNDLAQYDLVVADRDGSNARVVFPPRGDAGLVPFQSGEDFAWSPDGRQIALIYQGNLWIVDVEGDEANAQQLTLDGAASHPIWMQ